MVGSGSLKTDYIAPAAIALWRLEGSREQTSRSRWTTPRCQPAAGRHSETARARPAWASPTTRRTPESPRSQAALEAEPTGVGLDVDRRDTEYAAHAVGADADRGGGRGRLDAAAPPAPDIRRVEEQVGRLDSGQTARRELADLGVERPAHGADLVLREPLYAHLAAIRSIFLVDTPLAHDSAPAAAAALSARE